MASKPIVAVLYQALAPPVYGGVSKPQKPGGYRDSGADIAYTLSRTGTTVLTPVDSPDSADQNHWCFPDTEDGILSAVQRGATHLWANTVLFSGHPLQTSAQFTPFESRVRVIAQPPACVDRWDDKSVLNDALRRHGGLTLPRSWVIDHPQLRSDDNASHSSPSSQGLDAVVASIPQTSYPIVAKPVRGRGSHGVKICQSAAEVTAHVTELLDESPRVLLEEYLSGEEGTITVMPPSNLPHATHSHHWALPPVRRFNHVNGIAPYSGKVAVTSNSQAVSRAERESDPAYAAIMRECEVVGDLLQTTAPLRIDIRRFGAESGFALFDVNMKPNITGPGRPGREDQASLMGLAAEAVGWDYAMFLRTVLGSARELRQLRNYSCPLLAES
ncbi:glutathione synthetase ATP-binding domain-like protein [Penicillium alfredii]|uniref:Glutathione synthetase ATP-binding domain-like protein n=1 Tax=Penicillium alfredii TaxID=1506179 RepID=A0A9W9ELA8_9EURO|nr:glutathione synthetase ATP-binding domain-like protein [Penicillium alfredii]KAJ5083931.1 glutathione synthetase ATP-binding domain-like protein [Penicillium alfredii]